MIYNNNYRLCDDKELALFIFEGNETAFEELYDRYRPQVFHVALKYLKCTELAKETVQEVFLKIWLTRNTLPEILSIKAWIYQSTKNLVLNKLKRVLIEDRAKEYIGARASIIDLSTLNAIDHKECSFLIEEAIVNLPEQQRLVFEMARYENLTYEDIGHKLNISPLTVKTHMSRALRNLRLKMTSLGVEVPVLLFFIPFL